MNYDGASDNISNGKIKKFLKLKLFRFYNRIMSDGRYKIHGCLKREWEKQKKDWSRYSWDYYQLIYRVAFSQVKNHADAEDITQEVFLKIIRHDMRYQSMEHERAWIVRVTINLCRDLLKSKWHKTSVSMEEVSEAQRGSCENFTEIQDDMMWAVLQLPEKYRNCLYLFYYEDYSIKEIAQSLEMPENTVKTNLKRGRQALKEFLEK